MYDLSYDAENRLVSVTGPNVTASFVYDGDGRQVKSVINGVTTTFVGAHYQIVNGTVTKYYFAGASRIAMKTGSTLTYLLGDHLGSTSLTTDALGNLVSELRYKPRGETRYSSGTTATNYRYTGQREEVSFGLYFYNARWYDPQLGRFAQADSIVPGGFQGLDRYAYANNSPLVYVDPSGHASVCSGINADPECEERNTTKTPNNDINDINRKLMGLLGFKDANSFMEWRLKNQELYNKIFAGIQPGDILRFTLDDNGKIVTGHWMVVTKGDEWAFYSIDERMLMNPGENFANDFSNVIIGAGILHPQADGTYSGWSENGGTNYVGNIDMGPYVLPDGWQIAKDGGIVATMPQYDAMDVGNLIVGNVVFWGGIAIGQGWIAGVGAAWELSVYVLQVDRVPTYMDQRPRYLYQN